MGGPALSTLILRDEGPGLRLTPVGGHCREPPRGDPRWAGGRLECDCSSAQVQASHPIDACGPRPAKLLRGETATPVANGPTRSPEDYSGAVGSCTGSGPVTSFSFLSFGIGTRPTPAPPLYLEACTCLGSQAHCEPEGFASGRTEPHFLGVPSTSLPGPRHWGAHWVTSLPHWPRSSAARHQLWVPSECLGARTPTPQVPLSPGLVAGPLLSPPPPFTPGLSPVVAAPGVGRRGFCFRCTLALRGNANARVCLELFQQKRGGTNR